MLFLQEINCQLYYLKNVQISDQPDKTPIHGGKQWQSEIQIWLQEIRWL